MTNTTRKDEVTAAFRILEKALKQAGHMKAEADALFERYPLPEFNDKHRYRMRALNLSHAARDLQVTAHSQFKREVRRIAGEAAFTEFVPPLGYITTMPTIGKNRNHKPEVLYLGHVPAHHAATLKTEIAKAQAIIRTWSDEVREAVGLPPKPKKARLDMPDLL